jgi:hypothetical protein
MITTAQAAIATPQEDLSQLTSGELSRAWAVQIIRDEDFVTEIERRFGVHVPVRRPQ